MTFTTWVASLFAGVWRVVLTPLDTCKTVLQVEGPKGFASLMKKVSALGYPGRSGHHSKHLDPGIPPLVCCAHTAHPNTRIASTHRVGMGQDKTTQFRQVGPKTFDTNPSNVKTNALRWKGVFFAGSLCPPFVRAVLVGNSTRSEHQNRRH